MANQKPGPMDKLFDTSIINTSFIKELNARMPKREQFSSRSIVSFPRNQGKSLIFQGTDFGTADSTAITTTSADPSLTLPVMSPGEMLAALNARNSIPQITLDAFIQRTGGTTAFRISADSNGNMVLDEVTDLYADSKPAQPMPELPEIDAKDAWI